MWDRIGRSNEFTGRGEVGIKNVSEPGEERPLEVAPDELTLEQLGAVYARALGHLPLADGTGKPAADSSAAEPAEGTVQSERPTAPADEVLDDETHAPIDPTMIVEAALFVGHPELPGLTLQEISSLMRDVSAEDVRQIIDALNEEYGARQHAWRIRSVAAAGPNEPHESRYRLDLVDDFEGLRGRYLGQHREARLSNAAVEVLALVAYQPAITAEQIEAQRGRDSSALLTQLVRRNLLRAEKQTDLQGRRSLHYFPTDRFLELFGLQSLQELPEVDEVDRLL
jgi:segregation and condensation protein B